MDSQFEMAARGLSVIAEAANWAPCEQKDFLAPDFVAKLVPKASYAELQEIFNEIWLVSESLSDLGPIEVYMQIWLTPAHNATFDRVRAWCDDYVMERAAKRNSKDVDEISKYFRLSEEGIRIFNTSQGLKKTVTGLAFCNTIHKYLLWRFYKELLEVHFSYEYESDSEYPSKAFFKGENFEFYPLLKMYGRPFFPYEGRSWRNFIAEASSALKNEIRSFSADEKRIDADLESFITQTRTMSEFMLDAFDGKAILRLDERRWLFISWISSKSGTSTMPLLIIRDAQYSPEFGDSSPCSALVDSQGRLCKKGQPWEPISETECPEIRVIAHILLSKVWARIFASYEKIDFAAIRRGRGTAAKAKDAEDEEAAEAPEEDNARFMLSCADLEQREEAPGSKDEQAPKPERLECSLRLNALSKILASFGCTIRDGKGSEILVSKPGRKSYTLAKHGSNPEYHFRNIKMLLRRLNIPLEEWYAAIYS